MWFKLSLQSHTNLTFTTDEWHAIGLSFNHPSTLNSQNNKYFDLRVFVDDNIWNVTRITTFEYSQLTFSMGRKFNWCIYYFKFWKL